MFFFIPKHEHYYKCRSFSGTTSFCSKVQATVLGLLAALAACGLGWALTEELTLSHAAVLCCSSVVTAFTASLLQGRSPQLTADTCLPNSLMQYVTVLCST